jgi:hypothetical protein
VRVVVVVVVVVALLLLLLGPRRGGDDNKALCYYTPSRFTVLQFFSIARGREGGHRQVDQLQHEPFSRSLARFRRRVCPNE